MNTTTTTILMKIGDNPAKLINKFRAELAIGSCKDVTTTTNGTTTVTTGRNVRTGLRIMIRESID